VNDVLRAHLEEFAITRTPEGEVMIVPNQSGDAVRDILTGDIDAPRTRRSAKWGRSITTAPRRCWSRSAIRLR
jgi:hypothetical protein